MELLIKDVLRAARQAWDAGALQVQTGETPIQNGPRCQYSGPCAIGAAMPPEMRKRFDTTDGPKTIDDLIKQGRVTSDAPMALLRLQHAHDSFNPTYFLETLEELEHAHAE